MTTAQEATTNATNGSSFVTQQKAVYNWYESSHETDDVVDIYSPEWQKRITSLKEEFTNTYEAEDAQALFTSLKSPEDLDFSVFFLAHPISAFSLWHVLQALYSMDDVICGTSKDALEAVKLWQRMKPFEYLSSKKVKQRWKSALRTLKRQIDSGRLAGEALESKMHAILRAVERVEDAKGFLSNDFAVDLPGWNAKKICSVIEERCGKIDDMLESLDASQKSTDSYQQLEVEFDERLNTFREAQMRLNMSDNNPVLKLWILFRDFSLHMDGIGAPKAILPLYVMLGLAVLCLVTPCIYHQYSFFTSASRFGWVMSDSLVCISHYWWCPRREA